MIELQDPKTIDLAPSTRDLLAQVTAGIEELNRSWPFTAEVAHRIRMALLPDRIVASLNMEGIIATRRQTLAVMDAMRINESIGRGEQEIYNTLKADELVHDAVESGILLTEQIIREINRLLMEELRADNGQFRVGQVDLPGAPQQPPAAGDVPPLVRRLCEMYPLGESLHPVVQAAWLHAQFTLC
jgi:Fic family protein